MHIHVMVTWQKKRNCILFQLGREIAISEGNQTKLKLGLVQISVALDELNGGEIFLMCASSNIEIYATGMTKLEVNDKLVMLQLGISQCVSETTSS